MKYYRCCLPTKQRVIHGLPIPPNSLNAKMHGTIAMELEASTVLEYAKEEDSEYECAFANLVGWTEATTELLPDDRVQHYYHRFKVDVPLTHMVFATIILSKYKSVDLNAKAFPVDKAPSTPSQISESSSDDT